MITIEMANLVQISSFYFCFVYVVASLMWKFWWFSPLIALTLKQVFNNILVYPKSYFYILRISTNLSLIRSCLIYFDLWTIIDYHLSSVYLLIFSSISKLSMPIFANKLLYRKGHYLFSIKYVTSFFFVDIQWRKTMLMHGFDFAKYLILNNRNLLLYWSKTLKK